MIEHKTLEFRTKGRGTTDITAEVARAVAASGIKKGLCTVFLQHTSASLILCENADPGARRDLETLLSRLAPDGDPAYVQGCACPVDTYVEQHHDPRGRREADARALAGVVSL